MIPKTISDERVPRDEIWLHAPGESVQFLAPGESLYDYSVEQRDGKCFLVVRLNGHTMEVRPTIIHRITNIGDSSK
jgi:hypothetical protein